MNKYKIFFGDIHGHSGLSPDVPNIFSPKRYYLHARDVEHFDIAALSDHDTWGVEKQKKWRKSVEITEEFYEPHKFCTLHCYEWSSGNGLKDAFWVRQKVYGHKNVYFKNEIPDNVFSTNNLGSNTPKKLWDKLMDYDAITIPHHTAGGPTKPTDWSYFNNEMQPICEVYSWHGNCEYYGCERQIYKPTPGRFYFDALNMGHKMGVCMGTDTHSGLCGSRYDQWRDALINYLSIRYRCGLRKGGGIIAVLAEQLTRDSVFEAICARRTYGTTGPKIQIQNFSINGNFMGSEFKTAGDIKIELEATGSDNITIEVIKNGKLAMRKDYNKNHVSKKFIDHHIKEGTIWYLVKIHSGSEWALSSPIWVEVK